MERTIRIKGTGKAKTRPDTIEIPMTVEGGGQKYEEDVETEDTVTFVWEIE